MIQIIMYLTRHVSIVLKHMLSTFTAITLWIIMQPLKYYAICDATTLQSVRYKVSFLKDIAQADKIPLCCHYNYLKQSFNLKDFLLHFYFSVLTGQHSPQIFPQSWREDAVEKLESPMSGFLAGSLTVPGGIWGVCTMRPWGVYRRALISDDPLPPWPYSWGDDWHKPLCKCTNNYSIIAKYMQIVIEQDY